MLNEPYGLLSFIKENLRAGELPPAVVFNCHITGLAVARSLGKRQVPIIALDRDDKGYGLHSRYTTIAGRCPYPLDDERAFIDLLLQIGATLKQKAVLFPCLDEWVFAVARHRQELEEFFLFPFSELDTIERLLDKNLLYKKCEAQGIPIPRTFYVGEESPQKIAAEITFPCIVKPALQREFTNEFGDKVFRVESREEFLKMCERAAHHPLLAQEIVGAGVDSFYSLCSYIGRDGEAKGVFVGRKLEQYPPDFGTACMVDSRRVEEIAERGVAVLKAFNYQGISEVEFIYDDKSREYKLLDVNTRVWKWIGLPIHAGIDLPYLAYADAVNGQVEAAGRQRDGIRWTYLKDYIALRSRRRVSEEATLAEQDWINLIAHNTDAEGEVIDAVLSSDDPAPFAKLIESLFDERQYYCAC
jgi:predicted ATP-grasp superfamily ATP-dependent carboligase